jgi:NAD(P)-dependent dehydrogenase (short-subunit alcohol dehydrogenase family)
LCVTIVETMRVVNVKGVFFTMQKFLPLLAKGARVCFTSSVAANKGMGNAVVYSATKAAVRSMARTFATDLGPRGIRVNCVAAGPVVTPIFDKAGMSGQSVLTFPQCINFLCHRR